jgi:hypothetical protein
MQGSVEPLLQPCGDAAVILPYDIAGGALKRQFSDVWHLVLTPSGTSWLLDTAGIDQVGPAVQVAPSSDRRRRLARTSQRVSGLLHSAAGSMIVGWGRLRGLGSVYQ